MDADYALLAVAGSSMTVVANKDSGITRSAGAWMRPIWERLVFEEE
jgi:hypothetical protein